MPDMTYHQLQHGRPRTPTSRRPDNQLNPAEHRHAALVEAITQPDHLAARLNSYQSRRDLLITTAVNTE